VIRNAINDGTIIGPRYLAASQEITVPGGLGDTTQPHLPQPEFAFGAVVSGAEEMRPLRAHVRQVRRGHDQDQPVGRVDHRLSERGLAVHRGGSRHLRGEAKVWGKRVAAHARSTQSIKRCVRLGIEVIYHASFADTEALDLLEAHKKRALHRARPGLADQHLPQGQPVRHHARGGARHGLLRRTRGRDRDHEGAAPPRRAHPAGRRLRLCLDAARHERDGPEYFVKYLGMSTMEALLSATAWGAPMMRMGKGQLGHIADGYLADLLLIDGDPLADITVLQDKSRILAVMKDGEFHRAPELRGAQRTATRWAA
jgi:imidazolonepropionase-like amidohydrolase